MLELTALVVSAVARACEDGPVGPGDAIEVGWRHYRYDPPSVWFLDVRIERPARFGERVALMTR